jgi:hypothetical protein
MSGFENLIVEAGEPTAPCRLCLNREAATNRLDGDS